MAYLISLALTLLRTIGKWIVRLFWNQLILWFAMTAAAWVIREYGDDIKKAITSFNDAIRNGIFDARTYIEELEAQIKAKMDAITDGWISALTAHIEALANAIPAAFGVEEWFDGFRQRVAAKVGTLVHDAAFSVLAPLRTACERLHLAVSPIVSDLTALEQEIAAAFRGLYDRFWEALSALAQSANNAAAGLIAEVNGLADVLNGNVNAIQSKVNAQIYGMDANAVQVYAEADALSSYLQTHAPGEPLSPAEANALADAALAHFHPPETPHHLEEIDWDSMTVAFPDATGLLVDIDLPAPEDLPLFGISTLISDIDALCADLAAIQAPIDALGSEIEARFRASLPAILQQDASAGIKMIFGAAAIEAILIKREQILNAVETFKAEIHATRVETGNAITGKTQAVKQQLIDLEAATIGNLPALLQPASDRYKKELEDQIVALEEVVLVNIDKIAPPGEIDHILEEFPADIHGGTGPNLSDSEKFSIGDIHRLLCGYFSRTQRIALISYLIRQDSESKLEEIIKLPDLPEVETPAVD